MQFTRWVKLLPAASGGLATAATNFCILQRDRAEAKRQNIFHSLSET